MVEVKVADEVWIATALLHQQHPERSTFRVQEIVDRAAALGLYQPLRPGVLTHATQHCVANKRPNPGGYRMLYAAGRGERRLFRTGDVAHPHRSGKTTPNREEIPEAYLPLLDWYDYVYDCSGAAKSR